MAHGGRKKVSRRHLAPWKARQLETLFLSWCPWDHGAGREDFAFMRTWETVTLPCLRRLRLRGDVLYREDCDAITHFLNRHSHNMHRLQLQLSNRVATSQRGFVCPEQMFPHLGSLPKLRELVVTLPKTYVGNQLMAEHVDFARKCQHICMPLSQIQSKCPSLHCLIFLVEMEYAHVQSIPKEVGHIEVSRVISESKHFFSLGKQLQMIYFLECNMSLSAPRISIDDFPLEKELARIKLIHESPLCHQNALMLDASGVSGCRIGHKGFDVRFIQSVQERVMKTKIAHT
eukprot:Skav229834  [mRNA]  locus=scaffold2672:653626:654489:+ [translate_table: standard]